MRYRHLSCLLLGSLLLAGRPAAAPGDDLADWQQAVRPALGKPQRYLFVGATRQLKRPSDAARIAGDGSTVWIDPGVYPGDTAVWTQNDLILAAAGSGDVELRARGKSAENKAIWVIKGDRVEVRGIDFSGARSNALNGAGIRFEGGRLQIRNCRFHDNQMGLLTSHNPRAEIDIIGSEFFRNTVDYRRHGKLGHNIYIGRARRFSLRNSHVHDADTGHLVKSRARINHILYNRLTDEDGKASYLVDLAEGGIGLVMGNLLHKSADAQNTAAVSFGAEPHPDRRKHELYVIHNTLVSERANSLLLRNHSEQPALVANNLLQGDVRPLQGNGRSLSNPRFERAGLQAARRYDFHLSADSPAVDRARVDLFSAHGDRLAPLREYRHPRRSQPRLAQGKPDIGAYELQE